MSAPRVVVHAPAAVWGTPSASPFAIKLLTWLRLAEVPYDFPPMTRPPRSRTGKVPTITLDGQDLVDSGLIIDALTQRFDVRLDADLSAPQRAQAHVIRRLCEDHLYWVSVWERWMTPQGFEATSRDYFAHMPRPVRWLLARMLRPKVRKNLHGHGLGRLDAAEIEAAGRADLQALAQLIEGPFVLGEQPHGIDATVYAMLLALRCQPFDGVSKATIQGDQRLNAYVDRLQQRVWSP